MRQHDLARFFGCEGLSFGAKDNSLILIFDEPPATHTRGSACGTDFNEKLLAEIANAGRLQCMLPGLPIWVATALGMAADAVRKCLRHAIAHHILCHRYSRHEHHTVAVPMADEKSGFPRAMECGRLCMEWRIGADKP